MGDFRGFTHGLVKVTRQILQGQLLLTGESTEIPIILWDQLRDDPTQAKTGWSFLDDSRTRWPVAGATWLTGRLGRADPRFKRFIHTSTAELNMTAIDQYISRVIEFREKLSVAIHLIGDIIFQLPPSTVIHLNSSLLSIHNILLATYFCQLYPYYDAQRSVSVNMPPTILSPPSYRSG